MNLGEREVGKSGSREVRKSGSPEVGKFGSPGVGSGEPGIGSCECGMWPLRYSAARARQMGGKNYFGKIIIYLLLQLSVGFNNKR
jgi:hypothetical protein